MACRRTDRLTAALLAMTAVSCTELGGDNAFFDERIDDDGLAETRSAAIRVATFVRGAEVGGYVVFFEVDGELNTATDPYFVPAFCSYFGPGPLRDGAFRIVAEAPDGGEFVAQATFDRRERIVEIDIAEGSGSLSTESAPLLVLERVRDEEPEPTCPETREERLAE